MSINAWLKMREIIPCQWLEVRHEDLVKDLEIQARRALKFLGLEWDPAVLDFHQRSLHEHVHSPTYESVTKPINTTSIGRWRNYKKHLAPAYDQPLPYIREFDYKG